MDVGTATTSKSMFSVFIHINYSTNIATEKSIKNIGSHTTSIYYFSPVSSLAPQMTI